MNILYYPEINIPRTEWAIRAFLYYDEVAAIVPVTILFSALTRMFPKPTFAP